MAWWWGFFFLFLVSRDARCGGACGGLVGFGLCVGGGNAIRWRERGERPCVASRIVFGEPGGVLWAPGFITSGCVQVEIRPGTG